MCFTRYQIAWTEIYPKNDTSLEDARLTKKNGNGAAELWLPGRDRRLQREALAPAELNRTMTCVRIGTQQLFGLSANTHLGGKPNGSYYIVGSYSFCRQAIARIGRFHEKNHQPAQYLTISYSGSTGLKAVRIPGTATPACSRICDLS